MTQPTRPPRAAPDAPRVLVVGTDEWAVEQASEALSTAGLTVVTCSPPGEPSFPCNALVAGRECPLDRGFAVVVTVRARPLELPSPGETGVVCGVRHGAAVVTAGMNWRSPFAAVTARVVQPADNLPAVVQSVLAERAATLNLTAAGVPVELRHRD